MRSSGRPSDRRARRKSASATSFRRSSLRTTTIPFGRKVLDTGMPVKVAELLAALQTPAYIAREALIKPKHINKAKKAIKRAFTYQLEDTCFSLVELVSTCPTNWGMTPLDALKWAEEKMMPYYELGELKSPE